MLCPIVHGQVIPGVADAVGVKLSICKVVLFKPYQSGCFGAVLGHNVEKVEVAVAVNDVSVFLKNPVKNFAAFLVFGHPDGNTYKLVLTEVCTI